MHKSAGFGSDWWLLVTASGQASRGAAGHSARPRHAAPLSRSTWPVSGCPRRRLPSGPPGCQAIIRLGGADAETIGGAGLLALILVAASPNRSLLRFACGITSVTTYCILAPGDRFGTRRSPPSMALKSLYMELLQDVGLPGLEVDPAYMRRRLKASVAIGISSFAGRHRRR